MSKKLKLSSPCAAKVWMSHGDEAIRLPDGFQSVATSEQVLIRSLLLKSSGRSPCALTCRRTKQCCLTHEQQTGDSAGCTCRLWFALLDLQATDGLHIAYWLV